MNENTLCAIALDNQTQNDDTAHS